MLKLFTFLFLVLIVFACTQDQTMPDPLDDCDLENIGYTDNIAPLFETSCLFGSECHSATSTRSLISYDDILAYQFQNRIECSITQVGGCSIMPPPANGNLTLCEINQITDWVNNDFPR